ncbi:MAG: hypothetical protein RL282_889, partial [Bacteroidota bacterium]
MYAKKLSITYEISIHVTSTPCRTF